MLNEIMDKRGIIRPMGPFVRVASAKTKKRLNKKILFLLLINPINMYKDSVTKNRSTISGIAVLVYLKNLNVVARITADNKEEVVFLKRARLIKYARTIINDPMIIDGNLAAYQFIPNILNEAAISQ